MFRNTSLSVKRFLIINAAFFLVFNIGILAIRGFEGLQDIYLALGLVPADFWTGALWQPVTSMFLHGGFLHLLFNMVALWSIGPLIERTLGSKKFTALYMVSGLTGALFVLLFQFDSAIPTVGASGAIAGLLGALAIMHPNTMLLVIVFPVRARTAAIVLGAASILFAISNPGSQISHLGHLGGLVGGYFLTRYYIMKSDASTEDSPEWDSMRDFSFSRDQRPDMKSNNSDILLVYNPYTGKYHYEQR